MNCNNLKYDDLSEEELVKHPEYLKEVNPTAWFRTHYKGHLSKTVMNTLIDFVEDLTPECDTPPDLVGKLKERILEVMEEVIGSYSGNYPKIYPAYIARTLDDMVDETRYCGRKLSKFDDLVVSELTYLAAQFHSMEKPKPKQTY